MVLYEFQKTMMPMRIQKFTISDHTDGIKIVQNIYIPAELNRYLYLEN